MVMGPTYSRQDLRSVSKDTYTDGYSRTPRCGLVGPLDSYCTRPALSSKFSNEEHADIGLGTRGITYFKSQLVKLNIKYFHSWYRNTTVLMTLGEGNHYAWRSRLLPREGRLERYIRIPELRH